jgi:quaternary ammonium compound-resistance protein SugE
VTNGTAWAFLVIAGFLDVLWAIAMKKADGFRDLHWSAISLLTLAALVALLTKALAELPLGIAYPAWVGIGAVGTVIAGWIFFNEPVQLSAIGACGLILIGVFWLKMSA